MPRFTANVTSKLAIWTLALICIASFSLMLSASRTDSAIDDELAHIPAGYGYVHELDYRLNPEHPPLVKALAMLPVLFLNPTFPTTSTAWTAELNGQWDMGTAFLYESGNDANAIIQTARIFPILITILTLILLYFLARKLMGNWWALLPAALFGLSPTVLAHGHYVTTDVGAAFGITLATYFFLTFMEAPEFILEIGQQVLQAIFEREMRSLEEGYWSLPTRESQLVAENGCKTCGLCL